MTIPALLTRSISMSQLRPAARSAEPKAAASARSNSPVDRFEPAISRGGTNDDSVRPVKQRLGQRPATISLGGTNDDSI